MRASRALGQDEGAADDERHEKGAREQAAAAAGQDPEERPFSLPRRRGTARHRRHGRPSRGPKAVLGGGRARRWRRTRRRPRYRWGGRRRRRRWGGPRRGRGGKRGRHHGVRLPHRGGAGDGRLGILDEVHPEGEGAEAELLAVLESGLRDLEAVDVRPVGAALVDDVPRLAAALETRVLAGDRAVADDDVATRVPAHETVILGDVDGTAGDGHQSQAGHGPLLATRPRKGRKFPPILEMPDGGRQRHLAPEWWIWAVWSIAPLWRAPIE
jgi:hypothetical protein